MQGRLLGRPSSFAERSCLVNEGRLRSAALPDGLNYVLLTFGKTRHRIPL
jgi:hypothetical protein